MKKSTNKTEPESTMYETENDLELSRRSALIGLMNQRLADAVDLQTQMKQAHWNVKGPHFIGLHELFDQIDEAVEAYVDLIAERIVQLGGVAEGTARSAAAGRISTDHRRWERACDGGFQSLVHLRA
jgi:starvation-inducible DNA-binding protein